jgi:hypothetical protein
LFRTRDLLCGVKASSYIRLDSRLHLQRTHRCDTESSLLAKINAYTTLPYTVVASDRPNREIRVSLKAVYKTAESHRPIERACLGGSCAPKYVDRLLLWRACIHTGETPTFPSGVFFVQVDYCRDSRTLHYQRSVVRFYNNQQDRGGCQTTRKSYKT